MIHQDTMVRIVCIEGKEVGSSRSSWSAKLCHQVKGEKEEASAYATASGSTLAKLYSLVGSGTYPD